MTAPPRVVLRTTTEAARLIGVPVEQFPAWARRRRLTAARRVRLGRSTISLWDMDQVYDAERAEPVSWRCLGKSANEMSARE